MPLLQEAHLLLCLPLRLGQLLTPVLPRRRHGLRRFRLRLPLGLGAGLG